MNAHRQYAEPAMRSRAAGFTLMEVLLSIGILGVGLVLAAALFPAALLHNRTSAANTLGTLVCENTLTVVRARVRDADYVANHTDPTVMNELGPGIDFWGLPILMGNRPAGRQDVGTYDLVYPLPTYQLPPLTLVPTDAEVNASPGNFPDWTVVGTTVVPRSRYGAAVLAKRSLGYNNYQLIIASYRVLDPGMACRWKQVDGIVAGGTTLNVSGGLANIQVNAPIVMNDGTGYAFVKTISGGTVTLDRPIAGGSMSVLTPVGSAGTNIPNLSSTFSPVLHVMNVQAALRQ